MVFRDDSTDDDKRDAAFERLYAMCPAALRVVLRPAIQQAVNNASVDELSAMLIDAETITKLAESGDKGGIADIVKKYGVDDATIARVLPA